MPRGGKTSTNMQKDPLLPVKISLLAFEIWTACVLCVCVCVYQDNQSVIIWPHPGNWRLLQPLWLIRGCSLSTWFRVPLRATYYLLTAASMVLSDQFVCKCRCRYLIKKSEGMGGAMTEAQVKRHFMQSSFMVFLHWPGIVDDSIFSLIPPFFFFFPLQRVLDPPRTQQR